MTSGHRLLEGYLRELERELGGMPREAAADVVAELRSHVRDAAGGAGAESAEAVAAALERLGSPAALAVLYRTESLLAQPGRGRSPWWLLKVLVRWATLSAAGVLPLLGLIAGYVVAGSLFVAALAKPFAPGRVGLWRLASGELSLHLGFRADPPPLAEEVLGWWITPLGLAAGAAGYYLALTFARASIRRFRRRSGARFAARLDAPPGPAAGGDSWQRQ
jgi:uncharacterized membrane protein